MTIWGTILPGAPDESRVPTFNLVFAVAILFHILGPPILFLDGPKEPQQQNEFRSKSAAASSCVCKAPHETLSSIWWFKKRPIILIFDI